MGNGIQFGVNFQTGASLIHEQKLSLQDAARLDVASGAYGLRVYLTDGVELIIRQYGADDTPAEQFFTLESSGDTVKAYFPNRININIGIFLVSQYLEVWVPRSWAGDGVLHSGSGSVQVYDALSWRSIELGSSSGSVRTEFDLTTEGIMKLSSKSGSVRVESLRGQAVALSSSSGSVSVNGSINASQEVSLSATFGSVTLNGPVTAQRLTAKSASGSVKVNAELDIAGEVELHSNSGSVRVTNSVRAADFTATSTSGSVILDSLDCRRFTLESKSGSVKAEDLTGQGNASSSSGSVNIQRLVPTGDVELTSTSGSVTVRIPSSIAFLFEGQTGSGSIKGDYQILFSGENRKHGVFTNGDDAVHLVKARSSSGSVRIFM